MAEDPAALEAHDEVHRAGCDDQGGRGREGPDAPLREAHTAPFETAQYRGDRAKAVSLTAAELMTAPAVTVGPEELVAAAARRMYDRDVKRLPVVDYSGALVGIVTRADLLKVFLRSDEELRFDVLDHVIGGGLPRLPPGTLEVEVVPPEPALPPPSTPSARGHDDRSLAASIVRFGGRAIPPAGAPARAGRPT